MCSLIISGAGTEAAAYLEARTEPLLVSVITVAAELFAGVRDGEERHLLEEFLSRLRDRRPDPGNRPEKGACTGGITVRSHGVGLADALIAATAGLRQARLVTPATPAIFPC